MEQKENEKLVWIPSKFHKKVKKKALDNDSTIKKELTKILEKEFEATGD